VKQSLNISPLTEFRMMRHGQQTMTAILKSVPEKRLIIFIKQITKKNKQQLKIF